MGLPSSEPIVLVDTGRNSRRYNTRYQERRIRAVFSFLKLPAELRNMVYGGCLDTATPQKLIDRYYKQVQNCSKIQEEPAPFIRYHTPTLLLLNHQIHDEAVFTLRRKILHFDHGLLDLALIRDFVPNTVLRNVSSITIDDSGHELFQSNIVSASWCGYTHLFKQLASEMSQGHHLKSLTINLSSQDLVVHVAECWTSDIQCGYRDSLRSAMEALGTIRGVDQVQLVGFPLVDGARLKAKMESRPVGLLDLPRELRDTIYHYACNLSSINAAFNKMMVQWVDKSESIPYPPITTPALLLANRQISAEALERLYNQTLLFDLPSNHGILKEPQVPDIMNFICVPLLRKVSEIEIKLNAWEWIHGIKNLIASLSVSNTSSDALTCFPASISSLRVSAQQPALKHLTIHLHDHLKKRLLSNTSNVYPDSTLHHGLGRLQNLRGLTSVRFIGDLPLCYTEPLAQIMRLPIESFGHPAYELPKLVAVNQFGDQFQLDGKEVELNDVGKPQ